MEKIKPTCLRPGENLTFTTLIASSKEASIEIDRAEFRKGTMIYTDSSGYKDQVAALAILFTNGRRTAEL